MTATTDAPRWIGNSLNADEYVGQRDDLLDAQRRASDLASAPPADVARLREEEARLASAQTAREAAGIARKVAHDAIVDARLAGAPDEGPMAALNTAEREESIAGAAISRQTQVVRTLYDRLVAGVRSQQEAKANATLDEARERYRESLAALATAYQAIDAIVSAHEQEKAGADELAFARQEWRYGFDSEGFRERKGPDGRPYVTTPEPKVAIVLDGDSILTAGELVARLRASS